MVSGEKRNSEEERKVEKVTAILLDIEGTTTSLSFVKDKLFPYVREHLESYINAHWDEAEFKEDLKALKEQVKKDEEEKMEGLILIEEGEKEKEAITKNVLWQMDHDRKTTALKQLQGHIWKEGYNNGKLKGHVYSDVAPTLKKWSEEGRTLYIYSSGSVEAQKLLFGKSDEGDLLSFITGHFDTAIGPKTESSSYTNIIKEIGCDSEQVLFLTDVVKEAQAARRAGMQSIVVIREGNSPLTEEEKQEFVTVTSFKDLVFESSAKKKKMADEEEPAEVQSAEQTTKTSEENKKENHVNGDCEKMEVEAASEDPKPEVVESKEDCPDKTVEETENKTESKAVSQDDNKTESEDVDVDVVSDEAPGEKKEVPEVEKPKDVTEVAETKPEEDAAPKDNAVLSKQPEDEKKEGANEAEAKIEEKKEESTNDTPEDVPSKVEEKSETPVENGNEVVQSETKKVEETVESNKEVAEEGESKTETESSKVEDVKTEKINKSEVEEKPVENKEATKTNETEVNGKATNGEGEVESKAETKNGVNEAKEVEETPTVKKVIEEKPDSAVEIKA